MPFLVQATASGLSFRSRFTFTRVTDGESRDGKVDRLNQVTRTPGRQQIQKVAGKSAVSASDGAKVHCETGVGLIVATTTSLPGVDAETWIALAHLVTLPAQAQGIFISRPVIEDGDTIKIQGQRIGLQGVDAPESRQQCQDAACKPYRCGKVAADALDPFLAKSRLTRSHLNEADSGAPKESASRCGLIQAELAPDVFGATRTGSPFRRSAEARAGYSLSRVAGIPRVPEHAAMTILDRPWATFLPF